MKICKDLKPLEVRNKFKHFLNFSLGCHGLYEKLKSNFDHGLEGHDFDARANAFGSNYKAPPKRTPYWRLFLGALDDFMLKFLLVCATVQVSIEVGFAEPEDRSHCKKTTKFYKFSLD